MKSCCFFVTWLIALFGVTILNAQTTNSAFISASVVSAVSVEKNADVSFEDVSVTAIANSRLLVKKTATGMDTTRATLRSTTHALFTITGGEITAYDISITSTIGLRRKGGFETMTARAFRGNSSTGVVDAHKQSLMIGATLIMDSAQKPGTYTASDFIVTVNYN